MIQSHAIDSKFHWSCDAGVGKFWVSEICSAASKTGALQHPESSYFPGLVATVSEAQPWLYVLSLLIANIPAAYREILPKRLTCKLHFACGCHVKSAVFATRCGCLTCSYCNTSSSRCLPTFPNFKLPHLQLPTPLPCPLSTVSAPSSSDTPNVKWQMWNSLQIMLFLWRGVGWKCHYAHGLMELLRWPPAAGVDFHPLGCRSGGSVSSLSSDLRAEKADEKKMCLSCRCWSIYRTKPGLFVALCSSPAGYEMRCVTQGNLC